ncbi:MAG TPA: hypothetical protein VFU85_11420, partial [Nocardioides sp.]|nr:hypothetical protein [Nocardioides sp.]
MPSEVLRQVRPDVIRSGCRRMRPGVTRGGRPWSPVPDRSPMRPLSDLTRQSQLRLGAALRARVAGDDAA